MNQAEVNAIAGEVVKPFGGTVLQSVQVVNRDVVWALKFRIGEQFPEVSIEIKSRDDRETIKRAMENGLRAELKAPPRD